MSPYFIRSPRLAETNEAKTASHLFAAGGNHYLVALSFLTSSHFRQTVMSRTRRRAIRSRRPTQSRTRQHSEPPPYDRTSAGHSYSHAPHAISPNFLPLGFPNHGIPWTRLLRFALEALDVHFHQFLFAAFFVAFSTSQQIHPVAGMAVLALFVTANILHVLSLNVEVDLREGYMDETGFRGPKIRLTTNMHTVLHQEQNAEFPSGFAP